MVNPRALTGSFFLDFAKWIVSIPENSHMPCISGCQKPIKFKNSIPTSFQIAKKGTHCARSILERPSTNIMYEIYIC